MLSVITPGVYMGPPTAELDQITQLLTPAGFQVFPFNGLAVGGFTAFMQEATGCSGFLRSMATALLRCTTLFPICHGVHRGRAAM
jgi:hypothetical protein